MTFQELLKAFQYIAGGIGITLQYTFLSAFGGLLVGTFLVFLRLSPFRAGKRFASFYASVFRGTPLLVQLSVIYYGIPSLLDYQMSAWAAGILAFSLNSGAYVSEVLRSGLRGLDKGQWEAAQALGIPYFWTLKDLLLPQAFRSLLPSLVNEVINLLKETALISLIGEEDIMRRSQMVYHEKYTYFEPLLMAAFCYYIVVLALSALGKKLEKAFST